MSPLAGMVAMVWEALVQMGAVFLLKYSHILGYGPAYSHLALFGATLELAQFWSMFELGPEAA